MFPMLLVSKIVSLLTKVKYIWKN